MTQPLLHDAEVVLAAPAQVWSRRDGGMRGLVDGVWVSDVRIVSAHEVHVTGSGLEPLAAHRSGAHRVRFTSLLRGLDGEGADPRVRLEIDRVAAADGMTETLTVRSGRAVEVPLELVLHLATDLALMPDVKAGGGGGTVDVAVEGGTASWSGASVSARLSTDGFEVRRTADGVDLVWRTTVPATGRVRAGWTVAAVDSAAVVAAPPSPVVLGLPPVGDPEVDAWTAQALTDLEALQLVLPDAPGDVFLAAGAPWFLTLFGRDSIWAARLLLPHDLDVALGTLRVLARLQGEVDDPETGERPGGIVHELRRDENPLAEGFVLPPRYYGTIDATPLWILLLHDAWRAGVPDRDVARLLPALRRALGWLRDAVPEDGFLTYHDATGRGLANQGWKDSGDSVQWADGRLAEGPIALCEVQAYAHEAALAAVVLLRAFGDAAAADEWRDWAGRLKARFRGAFWVDGPQGGFPAIALDRLGRAVDSLTSNIGHLLGTGILDSADEHRVAALLVDPRLDSGAGLRTLSTDAAGYWPLSYHGGSVWAHDTAIAVHGLLRSGHPREAGVLARGLLRAARVFDLRMPELHSGDGDPVPYPAACRPQAWSAAAALVVRAALDPARQGRLPATAPTAPAAG